MFAIRSGVTWGGLLTGPGAWALSTQLNYSIVQWQCFHGVQVIPFIAAALAVVSLFGGAMSWQARRHESLLSGRKQADSTKAFVANIGVLAAALFALVIIMQGCASLILDGCLR